MKDEHDEHEHCGVDPLVLTPIGSICNVLDVEASAELDNTGGGGGGRQ
jgi:hypothetical protein